MEELKESEKETVSFAPMPHKHLFVVAQLILDVATSGFYSCNCFFKGLKDILTLPFILQILIRLMKSGNFQRLLTSGVSWL